MDLPSPGTATGRYVADTDDASSGQEFEYDILASFNSDYCTFSGSHYNFRTTPRVVNALKWDVEGDKMSGRVAFLMKEEFREAYNLDEFQWFEATFIDSR